MATPPHEPRNDRPNEALHKLTFGGRRPTAAERATPSVVLAVPKVNLNDLQLRCRAKAEATRRAIDRRQEADSLTDTLSGASSSDSTLKSWQESLIDCSYWIDATSDSPAQGMRLLADLAGCYDVLAASCALVEHAGERRGPLESGLAVLAEAQSALREALARLNAPDDSDQREVFEIIRARAAQHRIFLKRYMNANDRADPSEWPTRLDRLVTQMDLNDSARAEQDQRFRLGQLQEAIGQGHGVKENWQSLMTLIDEMVKSGVPPSDRGIRELLVPISEDLPEYTQQPPGFRLVIREIDRFLARGNAPSLSHRIVEPTAEVVEVARLLAGRSIVLIGGDRRPEAQNALVSSLGLDQLIWVETREHQAVATFEPEIARPEVALVLLAIRWSSHAFGEVKHRCDRLGKLLVRLPGGYHPNQVAAQILSQCGDRLRNS